MTTANVSIIEGCSFNVEQRKLIWYSRKKKNEHAVIDLSTTLQLIKLFHSVLVPKKLYL